MNSLLNLMFWINAAMTQAAVSCTLAGLVFVISVLGVGIGAGRLMNTRWKSNLYGWLISVIIGLITATGMLMYNAMGIMKDTLMPAAKEQLTQLNIDEIVGNNRLRELAFSMGVKALLSAGEGVDGLDENVRSFVLPGENAAVQDKNREIFVNAVIKTISKGEVEKGGKPKPNRVKGLADQAPFSYGASPISTDKDGSFRTKLIQITEDRPNDPISVDETDWYNALCKELASQSIGGF